MSYSRNFLLSLRNWWKPSCLTFYSSHASSNMMLSRHVSPNKPLTRQVWERLQAFNILPFYRSKRGGRNSRPLPTIRPIKPWITPRLASRQTKLSRANYVNKHNLLNIQLMASTSKESFRGFPELFL